MLWPTTITKELDLIIFPCGALLHDDWKTSTKCKKPSMNRFKSMDRIQLPQVHTNVPPWYVAEFGQDSRPIRGRLVRWVRHLPTPSLTQNNAFPVMMHPDCESYVGTSLHPQSKSLPRTHTYTHWLEAEQRAQEPSSFVRKCTMRTIAKVYYIETRSLRHTQLCTDYRHKETWWTRECSSQSAREGQKLVYSTLSFKISFKISILRKRC
jgi:hypothetical protein